MKQLLKRTSMLLALSIVISFGLPSALAQTSIPSDALVKALRQGGYVIVMRHAASPRTTPDKATANPDNPNQERQLDAAGRASAKAMGQAMRDLKIPVGDVLVSPTYRARETAKLAEWTQAKPVAELGDGGQNMRDSSDAATQWLQKQVTQFPKGTNSILITHLPNISGAFPQLGIGLADGEALIFGPDSKGGATLVGRVKIEEWPAMRF